MDTQRHEIGMIGLGAMGRNMLLNMADHGFPVAGYDNDREKVETLRKESAEHTKKVRAYRAESQLALRTLFS